MKSFKRVNLFMVCLISIFLVGAYAGEKKITKTFGAKSEIQIKTVSGDCIVNTSAGNKIQVVILYTYPEDVYKPSFEEAGDTLVMKEKFEGSAHGSSTWTVTVPVKTKITFHSASGDFSAAGLKNDLKAKTASGDFNVENIEGSVMIGTASGDLKANNISGNVSFKAASGDMDIRKVSGKLEFKVASGDLEGRDLKGDITIKTASGDIDIENAEGSLDVKTASGEVEASKILLKKASVFKTASGDIEVQLAESAKYDLTLASASGNAVLDYNGNPLKGYFEFTAKKTSGKIVSPVKFDKEEEFEQHGQKYLKKSVTLGGSTPKILIKTASGKAELDK